MFQISGDSMLPIPSESYIIASYVANWTEIKDGDCCIIVTRDEGIVYKRIWSELDKGFLLLKSDNHLYEPYKISAKDIVEIWSARGYLSFDLPKQGIQTLDTVLNRDLSLIKNDVGVIKNLLLKQKPKK